MGKISVIGDVVVIKSNLKYEDLKLVEKARPKVLDDYDMEDGKKVLDSLFSIGTTDGNGSVTKYGITFNSAGHDGEGLAQVTVPVPAGDGDVKERVAEAYGVAVMRLAKLEEKLPAVISEIKASNKAMLDGITLM